ncbi:helix-turn-helix domain-containing protein [Bradyrhizobium hipponense]|uniref:Helix-turn-helix domain-containing protein n=1 Tax=Bradyrhizobium hipponense TaxID=2605638 RepID=A0A5S4YQS0_9BRAD|nr:XRE family transcriptional regulator [Bradyrhizobium hipponense]TYO62669.1 helix-turn-helix domain-containing protein [Bradyrhizobium hipponense]
MHDRLPARRHKTSEAPGSEGAISRKAPTKSRRHPRAGRAGDDAIIVELGGRVKRLRTQAGLTLEEFAAQSGVSRAMLSKVERGEKSPTLAIIVRIAKGLNVSMSTLMGAEPDPAQVAVIRKANRLAFKDPETGFERHNLSPSHLDNDLEFLLHRIPPGESSGELPPYKVPTEKYLVVHEGQLTVQTGEANYVLDTGDSFYFDVRESYRFINAGRTPCAYYLVIRRRRA